MAWPSSDHTALADSSSEFAPHEEGTRVTLGADPLPVTPDRRSELERLFARLIQTQPGIVRTISVLVGEIEAEVLPRHELADLARALRIVAGGLDAKAGAPLSPS